jgi:hypothetical protein
MQIGEFAMVSRTIPRTSLDEACKDVLGLLAKNQMPYSISGLARKTGLHRQTVEKCVELISTLEDKWLENYKLKLVNVDRKRIVALEKRMGLSSYPQQIQELILRSVYFEMPSPETSLLVNLYLKDATSGTSGIPVVDDPIVTRLLKQGQLLKAGNRVYLSDEGMTVAKGALKIFPFLEEYRSTKKQR